MCYVLDNEAGSEKKVWQHGLILDCDGDGNVRPDRTVTGPDGATRGKRLADFVEEMKQQRPQASRLTTAEVAAIRLYTTAAYKLINDRLREGDDAAPQHPLPMTVLCLDSGVKKMRIAKDDGSTEEMIVWRGIRDTKVPPNFLRGGGTELAPMSTTLSLETAIHYSKSDYPMLMRITSERWAHRGTDVTWLSAFPKEREMLFPPRSVLFPKKSGAGPIELEVTVGAEKKKWRIYDVCVNILAANQ